MILSEMLSVRPGITALIGGGGKTTAMYTLARELSEDATVVCTTCLFWMAKMTGNWQQLGVGAAASAWGSPRRRAS